MLNENFSQFLALQTEPAFTAVQKKGKRKANKKPAASAPVAPSEASKDEPKKAIVLDLSHIVVPSSTSRVPRTVHKPAEAAFKPSAAAAAPSSSSKEQGPDLSSEKSRKLRNFLDLVKKYGYYLAKKSKGSHFAYRHRESNNTVSIPQHDILSEGTARAIMDEILSAQEEKTPNLI